MTSANTVFMLRRYRSLIRQRHLEEADQADNPARLSLRPGAPRLKPLGFVNTITLAEIIVNLYCHFYCGGYENDGQK